MPNISRSATKERNQVRKPYITPEKLRFEDKRFWSHKERLDKWLEKNGYQDLKLEMGVHASETSYTTKIHNLGIFTTQHDNRTGEVFGKSLFQKF